MRSIATTVKVFACAALLSAATIALGAPDRSTLENRGLMYRLEKNGAVVYLYGTTHIGRKNFFPLQREVHQAIDRSEAIAVEVNLLSPSLAEAMNSYGLLPEKRDLSEIVGLSQADSVVKILQKHGIPPAYALRIKPGIAALTIGSLESQGDEYFAGYSVDSYILGYAKAKQKPIIEIEGAKQQFQMFDEVDMQVQGSILMDAVKKSQDGSAASYAAMLIKAWEIGDESAVEVALTAEPDDPLITSILQSTLFVRRNKKMTEFIESVISEKKTIFVAVGALHLVGEGGLVSLLKARGFSSRRIALKPENP